MGFFPTVSQQSLVHLHLFLSLCLSPFHFFFQDPIYEMMPWKCFINAVPTTEKKPWGSR